MASSLTIVGASARAAVASALRAGFEPFAIDLFADADLRAMCPVARCPFDDYPRGLIDLLRESPSGPWIYTGGLENHPKLIGELASIRPLWGNGSEALALCRSPFVVERLLREAGLPALEVRARCSNLPNDRRWLHKPLRGAGGSGIEFATDGCDPGHYVQEFVDGPSMSAVYVRAHGATRLLGVTEQLIGPIDWLNAPPFRYAGNIGPVDPGQTMLDDLERIGQVLGTGCGLLGLFGVDFIVNAGRPWVVELNPRYVASIEVLERATGLVALEHHASAFDASVLVSQRPTRSGLVGKAILYAAERIVVPAGDSLARWPAPMFADVPNGGEVIESGWPVLTGLAEGFDREECVAKLGQCVERVRRELASRDE